MTAFVQKNPLGNFASVIAGQSPEGSFYNDKGHGLPFYQGKKDFGDRELRSPTAWTTQITKEAVPGDILMSVRAPVGPVNFSREHICIGRGLAAIRCRDGLSQDFLFYQLLGMQSIIAGKEGAVFSSINKAEIEALPIVVPSLEEQRRIVAILDEAFEGIATAKANAEKNLENVSELFDAFMQNVFESRVGSLTKRRLVDLCDRHRVITYGVIKLGDFVEDGVPCLRTSNVRWLSIDINGMKLISQDLSSEYSRTILRGGEVLVNVRGTLGGVAVVPHEMAGWNVSREVAVVPVDSSVLSHEYASFWIGSRKAQEWLAGVKKGAAYTGINIEDLRDLPVPLPDLDSQRAIVDDIVMMRKNVQRLQATYRAKLAAIEEFKKTLLHQAFTGQL